MINDVSEREWKLLSIADPAARAALDAKDADSAYEAIAWSRGDLLDGDDDAEMPHVGELFCTWADLEDLYEIGRSTPEEFHALVRVAAERWLGRPAVQSSQWLELWITDTRTAVAALVEKDGIVLGKQS